MTNLNPAVKSQTLWWFGEDCAIILSKTDNF